MPKHAAILLALFASTTLASVPALAIPDAQMLSMKAQGSDFRGGDRVPIEIRIRSSADVPLPSLPVTLTIDDDPYAEWKTPHDLPRDQIATWSLTWTATRGSHLFVASVDPLNDLLEADEANNSTFINIGVAEPPEPFPWPPTIAGLASFAVGAALALIIRRVLRARPPPGRETS
jgi:hypothetical protein